MVGEAGLGRPSSIVRRRQAVGHLIGELFGAGVLDFNPRWYLNINTLLTTKSMVNY